MYHLARSLYLYATSKEEYSILLLGLDNAGKTTLLSQIKALFAAPAYDGTTSTTTPTPSLTAGNTVPTVGQNVATVSLPDMYLKIWDVGGQMSLRRLWQSYYKSAHAVVFVVDSTDLGGGGDVVDLGRVQGSYFLEHQQQQQQQQQQQRRKNSVGGGGGGGDEEGDKETDEQEGEDEDHEEDDKKVKVVGGIMPQTPVTPVTPGGGGVVGVGTGRLEECRRVLESVLAHEDTVGIPILVLANKQDREDCVEVVRIKEGFVRRVFEGKQGAMVRDSRVLPVSALDGTGVREAVEWVRSRVVWNKESRPPVMR